MFNTNIWYEHDDTYIFIQQIWIEYWITLMIAKKCDYFKKT